MIGGVDGYWDIKGGIRGRGWAEDEWRLRGSSGLGGGMSQFCSFSSL